MRWAVIVQEPAAIGDLPLAQKEDYCIKRILEILYEKYILISFSAREWGGEKGNRSMQRSCCCNSVRWDSFFFFNCYCWYLERSLEDLIWAQVNIYLVPQPPFFSSSYKEMVFCIHKSTYTPMRVYIFLTFFFPTICLLLLSLYLLDRLNRKKGTICLSNYCTHGGMSAWIPLLIVSCRGALLLRCLVSEISLPSYLALTSVNTTP